MHTYNHNEKFDFLQSDPFLKGIEDLKEITQKLNRSREEMRANLKRLEQAVQFLHDEIHQSVNK